jgi:lipopolysaccharide/colanic/teichoic acid biosynthesis glycosyltransferase
MAQNVYIEPRIGNNVSNSVSLESNTENFTDASTAVIERPLESAADVIPPIEIPSELIKETSAFNEVFCRLFDIVIGAVLLLLSSPVIALIVALVKISSTGPVLYKQKRVGQRGRIFVLYKFRTMIKNAEKHTGPVLASKNDDRVTPLGRILRCSRLDELPQLFNVLKSDMSLVGPRPERPFFVSRNSSLQGRRLAVKPGITGLAQIRAFYDLKPEHKLRYDSLYIQNRSLFLNLYILLQTVPVIFLKKGW